MNKLISAFIFLMIITSSIQCAHHQTPPPSKIQKSGSFAKAKPSRSQASADWLAELPTGDTKEFYGQIERRVMQGLDQKTPDGTTQEIAERISRYVSFIMLNYEKTDTQAKTRKKLGDEVISRIFQSSTQFILCPDLADFECLEKTPIVEPGAKARVEDPSLELGKKRTLNASFESASEWYFNDKIFIPESELVADKTKMKDTLAAKLEKKIKSISNKKTDAIYMAVYGVDDIEESRLGPGSMKGVYDALLEKIKSGIEVKGVFDHMGLDDEAPKPGIVSYIEPRDEDARKRWIFTELVPKDGKLSDKQFANLDLQYDRGTMGLIRALAQGAKKEDDAKGRIEWKDNNIMHNKFLVFKKGTKMSVWTGTANVSRTCMGTERNSNMGFYITNNDVAQAFIDEFNEMYEFQEPVPENKDKNYIGAVSNDFPYGRFHNEKSPNTPRYFYFSKDETDFKLYFSPTDDAEHRAILPMLHSAKEGDTLRLSMFGAGGIELARAVQLAAARGVKVEIIADSPTARGNNQFLGKSGESTLFNENPYDKKASIALKNNQSDGVKGEVWKQNHQKIGLLIRKNGKAEQLIFGSQNWSISGNDISDENLIALRSKKGLAIGEAFDKHFKDFLWPKGKVSVLLQGQIEESQEGQ